MALVNLTTNLKSLRYGKDTIGGGSSNQPYVKTAIPDKFSDVGRTGGPDFLLRGGTLLPKIVVNDVSRMTKMFFDFKSPAGPLFFIKQNLLSLTNVNSQEGYVAFKNEDTPPDATTAIGDLLRSIVPPLNQGIYTPLSTIAQSAGNALGLHLDKQGLGFNFKTTIGSPDGNTLLGLPTYLNTIHTNATDGNKSRLFGLLDKVNNNTGADNDLYSYSGGPGATLGVGKTTIRMVSDQRTGINNPTLSLLNNRFKPTQFVSNKNIFKGKDGFNNPPFSLSFIAPQLIYSSFDPVFASEIFREDYLDTRNPSVYEIGPDIPLLKTNTGKLVSGTQQFVPRLQLTQDEIDTKEPVSKGGSIGNFSKPFEGTNYIPKSIDYTQAGKIETRVNLGDPGKRANRSSYTIGRRNLDSSIDSVEGNSGYKNALDQINALPIYQSNFVTSDSIKNDLVKFRIGVISNKEPDKKTYIHFRAFINSFDDSYTADWKSTNYMGRGEKFYKYGGFDRKISMDWTVAAQSKQELIPMWQKLNYLASVNAPDYSDTGYMSGNLITLTVGGYLYEQVGIMTGLSLGVPQESPWDIAISDTPNATRDASVKEMPMICNVSGFNFIPIHNFVPKVQENDFAQGRDFGGGKFVGKYGQEQYIALSQTATDGKTLVNNYGGESNNLNYIPK